MKKLLFAFLFISSLALAQKAATPAAAEKKDEINSDLLNGMRFRSVGPAVTSGRVSDFAVNPTNRSQYYVTAASGGVWKTDNAGTTYTPVFDAQGSYSIGCISTDPNNFNTVWVGTGENNNQRAVCYGDGVYRSDDGGKSWKNMGLKTSEHIGKIIVDPRNSDVVYVAAYGPLWGPGGERGIYKTTDGGKTWKQILFVSENTGFNEVHFDPRNADVLYATAHQRRRHVFTYISGGPESAIYKSTDAGATWNKIMNGMPQVDLGRIGMAVSPVNSDYLFAIVETSDKDGGIFRSTDRGASWSKQNDFQTAGNYYQEIFCDPTHSNKIYVMDFLIRYSTDGGKTLPVLGEKYKHVDNHAFYVDPKDPNYMLAGCDGGVYETFDGAQNWQFKANLPITQFYRVEVDNAYPFYNIYGGTQDNNSMGGPSRTLSKSGITNADWFITNGGDGFESQIDPNDPNIVYAQSQYGGLVRYDKKSGENLEIKPIETKGDTALRWNWDSPLVLSKHLGTRIYFCANKVFKSDDRGNTWQCISPDLSRKTDRNKLPVMGKVWSMDAVAKNQSTSFYGNIVAFSESPKNQNLLYAGTDDGLIQVTYDGGKSWNKTETVAGVPAQSYVSALCASQHNESVLYATFNNKKSFGDLKPYVFRSNDKGKTFVNITANLPVRGSVNCIVEDFINPDLLFVGTEFGLFVSIDGGKKWTQMKSGLPTIGVWDIAIQQRESDLVLATFGRGFYVLDDYSPLRTLKESDLSVRAKIYPIKESLMYVESAPLGHRGKSFQGESFYIAPNPPVAAVFTYYLKENLSTQKQKRKETEKEKIKNNQTVDYPSYADMLKEDREEEPFLLFQISDEKQNVVRNIKSGASKGINRITWDFRYNTTSSTTFPPADLSNPYAEADLGHWVVPGKYFVKIFSCVNGEFTEICAATPFNIKSLNAATLAEKDKQAVLEFSNKVAELRRVVVATEEYRKELLGRLKYVKIALTNNPAIQAEYKKILATENGLKDLDFAINGNSTLAKRDFESLPGLYERIERIMYGIVSTTCAPTETFKQSYQFTYDETKSVLNRLKKSQEETEAFEALLDKLNMPYTPGRMPVLR